MQAAPAEAAEEAPRAAMIAAPRFCTVGMKSPVSHLRGELAREIKEGELAGGETGKGGLDSVFSHLVSLPMASIAFLAESKGKVNRCGGEETCNETSSKCEARRED